MHGGVSEKWLFLYISLQDQIGISKQEAESDFIRVDVDENGEVTFEGNILKLIQAIPFEILTGDRTEGFRDPLPYVYVFHQPTLPYLILWAYPTNAGTENMYVGVGRKIKYVRRGQQKKYWKGVREIVHFSPLYDQDLIYGIALSHISSKKLFHSHFEEKVECRECRVWLNVYHFCSLSELKIGIINQVH